MARTLRTTMRVWPAILVCLALVFAGCGGEDESSGAPSGGGGGGGQGLEAPITFKLTGGDAFRKDRMTVQPDGSAQVTTRKGDKPAQLTDEELSELSSSFEKADLPEIPENSTTEPPIPDALSYSFVYEDREVITDSGSLPEDLKPLIGTFVKLVDRYGAK